MTSLAVLYLRDTTTVANGGQVFSSSAHIEGGSTANVTGSGSTWQTNDLEVDGELTASLGGLIDVANELEVSGSLTLNNGASLQVGQRLNVILGQMGMDGAAADVGVLSLTNGSVVGAGTVSGAVWGDQASTIAASGGDLSLGDAARYDGFLMEGTIEVGAHTATVNAQSFATLGLLTTIDGGSLQATNGVHLRGGHAIVGYGSVVGPVSSAIGSTISATGDLVVGDATRYDGFFSDGLLHANAHTVTLNDKNEAVLGSLTTIDGGTLAAANGFLVLEGRNVTGRGFIAGDFKNQGSVIGDGTAANEKIIFDSPWVVSGKGTFVNTLILGTFAPGESPGIVTGTNQGFGGIVQIELGGTTPGFGNDKHDQIVDTATILLSGLPTLEILPWNNFLPQIGDEFTILDAQSLSGTFGEVIFPNAQEWYVDYDMAAGDVTVGFAGWSLGNFDQDEDIDADDIDLLADAIAAGSTDSQFDINGDSVVDDQDLIAHVATLVERTDGGVGAYRGDFNLDGYVDATDLAIFKSNFGSTSGLGFASGNCNTDAFIDATDLAIFKATFGFSGTPDDGGNPPAVPDPATLSLLALGGLALLRKRRK
ncbi:MAG: PEP-CTERM sorting domain-containing protein [Planctomycetota bacterium]